jgi:hypothetical protein
LSARSCLPGIGPEDRPQTKSPGVDERGVHFVGELPLRIYLRGVLP